MKAFGIRLGPRRPRDVRDIRTWPPGTFMVYDNREVPGMIYRDMHVGLGMVIANDGHNRIRVIWDVTCDQPYLEYDVSSLNPHVIRCVE